MHDYHLTFASVALFFLVGSLFVAGSACMLSSRLNALADQRKDRERRRRGESDRAISPLV
jgi:hypothetical protein